MHAYHIYVQSYIQIEKKFEEEYKNDIDSLLYRCRSLLNDQDHGMLEYLVNVWSLLEISYKERIETLLSIIWSDSAQTAYSLLDRLTRHFQFSKEKLKGILELIRVKERRFGGLFQPPLSIPQTLYEKRKADSDLYQISKQIQKAVSEFYKETGEDI